MKLGRRIALAGVVLHIVLAAGAGASPLAGRSRLDPHLRRAARLAALAPDGTSAPRLVTNRLRTLARSITLDVDARPMAAVVRVRHRGAARYLETLGGQRLHAGTTSDLYRLPLAALERVAALPGVEYVESTPRLQPLLNLSVPLTGAAALHEADPSVTGAGVVYGAIDTGIDIRHPTFLNADGTTRVEAFWDVCDVSGDPPAGFEDTGGSYYTSDDINAALAGEDTFGHRDLEGHGTMTTAIGAGSGDTGVYEGMAPGASIVMVAIFGENGTCDNPNAGLDFGGSSSILTVGARFIESIAAGRPFVVNMSLGEHLGPHDGTALLDQELTVIADAPGRALVASSGNEGEGGIHAGGTVEPGQTLALHAVSFNGDPGVVEIWYPGDSSIEIRVREEDNCSDAATTGGTAGDGTAYFIDNARDGVDARNGDHVAYAEIYGDLDPVGDADACVAACDHFTTACGQDPFGAAGLCIDKCMANWSAERTECVATYESDRGPDRNCGGTFFRCLGLEYTVEVRHVSGPSARFDAYADRLTTGIDSGAREMTVGQPASALGVIAVGALVHRASAEGGRRGLEAQGRLGDLTDYSSAGPMRDGRDKPEIVAPAELISSALANGYEPFGVGISEDGLWQTTSGGTSASSPHVAGAIALLLQQYPSIDLPRIHEALALGALVDEFTEEVPNMTWGWGKLQIDSSLSSLSGAITDADADGFTSLAAGGIDCDDTRTDVGPRAPELGDDEIDNDCDGQIDEELPTLGVFTPADPGCFVEAPDAGVDAGEPPDASVALDSGVDAAAPEVDAGPPLYDASGGGCDCRATPGPRSLPTGLPLLGLALVLFRLVALRRVKSSSRR